MRLAIADPPYPPRDREKGGWKRSSAWYADHPDAAAWDDPARHRRLLLELLEGYDGWAIATAPDGLEVYGPLPSPARIMAWVKPGSMPGASRIIGSWEAVILYPPAGRRKAVAGGCMPDVLTAPYWPRRGPVPGRKPPRWTHWVLEGLGYDPDADTVADLFPGTGAVADAIAHYPARFTLNG